MLEFLESLGNNKDVWKNERKITLYIIRVLQGHYSHLSHLGNVGMENWKNKSGNC